MHSIESLVYNRTFYIVYDYNYYNIAELMFNICWD